MAVFNGHKYLSETIESILDQSFSNFEFIIIDDGSTDGSSEIIDHYHQKDPRVIVIQNRENIGLALSLNKGLQIAKGKYIARMDADDVCLPERFQTQFEYLEEHPEIWIVGSSIIHIDDQGNEIRRISYPNSPNRLRWNMLFGTTGLVCHPCAMMRSDRIREAGLYRNLPASQDMDLWCRFFGYEPFPITNLDDSLIKYRWHENSFSTRFSKVQHEVSSKIRLETINREFAKSYDFGMIESYRAPNPETANYSKQALIGYISAWFEIFDLFAKRFKLNEKEWSDFYQQILYRCRNYINLLPQFSTHNQKIWLPVLITTLGFKHTFQLLRYKISRHLVNSKIYGKFNIDPSGRNSSKKDKGVLI